MPRDLPIGNGSLLVNFDRRYQLRDIYWPHIGQENHTEGHPSRLGVWADGQYAWTGDDSWSRELNYEEDTLVTAVTLRHPGLRLTLQCQDAVDFHENLLMRRITVRNESHEARDVRLFFTHDLHISGNAVGDTAYYEPERRAVYHYKGRRWFMVNGAVASPEGLHIGVDGWAVGRKEIGELEGAWRDAEDGALSGNAVAQGSVDSAVALNLRVGPSDEATAYYWMAVGEDFREVTRINRAVRAKGPQTFLDRTRHYWALWVSRQQQALCELPDEVCRLYRRSLLIMRSQIDNGGGVIAATDFDISHYGSDTYSYVWPRDGALVIAAMGEAGYLEPARQFFNFCHKVITEEGYLLHKYTPDGALASSWHGWYQDGRKELPIQEDETALVIWALWRHFERTRDVEFVKPLYRGLVIRAANWLQSYRDASDGMPLASWDLWEERRGVLAWTVGAVWGGLQAAANFADAFGEKELAQGYRKTAEEIRAGASERLWNAREKRYCRMAARDGDGAWRLDDTLDSSLCGLWLFGMFSADDPRIVATMNAVEQGLRVRTAVGGLARYCHDPYQQALRADDRVPGNPWFISALWLAQWRAAVAKTPEDLNRAMDLLRWAVAHAFPSGVMAEQVHPETGEPLSVSPLTWSHAAFVQAVNDLGNAAKRM